MKQHQRLEDLNETKSFQSVKCIQWNIDTGSIHQIDFYLSSFIYQSLLLLKLKLFMHSVSVKYVLCNKLVCQVQIEI